MSTLPGLKSIGGLWIVQIIKMALSIAVSIITIRYLGPEQYGVLGIAGAFVVLFSALAGMPQGGLIVRELARVGDAGGSVVLSTAFVLRLAGAALQLLLTAAAVVAMGSADDVRLAAVLISMASASAPFLVLGSALEFAGRFDRVAAIDLTASLATSMIRLVLVFVQAPLMWFAGAALLDASVAIVLYLVAGQNRGRIAPIRGWSGALAATLIKDSWPLVLTGMAIAIYTRTDVLFISGMLGTTEAGWYTAAIRMTEVLYFFPGVIASIFFPSMARRRLDDRDEYYRMVTNSCGASFWLGVGLAAALTVGGPIFFDRVLGAQFSASIGVVQISAWSIALVALSTALNSCLTIEHATRVPLYATIVGATVNVLALFVMVPWLGIVGAALSTLLAQIASLLAAYIFYRDARLFKALMMAVSPAFLVTMGRAASTTLKRGSR